MFTAKMLFDFETLGRKELWTYLMKQTAFASMLDWTFWDPGKLLLLVWFLSFLVQFVLPYMATMMQAPDDNEERDLRIIYKHSGTVKWRTMMHYIEDRCWKRYEGEEMAAY